MTNRREFLINATATTAAVAGGGLSFLGAADYPVRKFRMSLNPFAIGVQTDQKGLVDLAYRNGFEAIIAMPEQLAKMSQSEMDQLLADMKEKKLAWGSAGLPVDFRRDDQRFEADLKALPGACDALRRAGVTRMGTWIMPMHAELTYVQNFKRHAGRLRECAKVLSDRGLKLGLEYVGPQTLRNSQRFPFIHTMAETRELISEIGSRSIGLQLDSFHWYCAGETVEDLLSLTNHEIVLSDLNDARGGIPAEEQIDGQRELPSATGVIDLKAFLGALATIGFDGPIRAEPFNAALNKMENEMAVKATYEAMKRSFDLIRGE